MSYRIAKLTVLVSLLLGLVVSGRTEINQIIPASPPLASWTNGLNMQFKQIAAGEFTMGSPTSEPERSTNETQHVVKITKPFWLGATHVTVAQFAAFAKASGYQTAAEKQGWSYGAWNVPEKKWDRLDGGSWRNPGFHQSSNHPVVCVTWNDANALCDWLSKTEGRKYRLPTEAEWEYASRAGQIDAYPWGDDFRNGKGWLNGSDQSSSNLFSLFPSFPWSDGFIYTSPVGKFHQNAWGLSDPLGNALQWCGDWFGDYPKNTVIDPQGPLEGKERVLRGGSFVYGPKHCRCAFRGRNLPDFQNFYVGFRVVMEAEPKTKFP